MRLTSFLLLGTAAVLISGCGGGGGGSSSSGPPPPPPGFADGHYKGNYTENARPLSGGVPVPGGTGWLGNTNGAIDITVTSGVVAGVFTPTGGAAAAVGGTIDSNGDAVILVTSVKPTAEFYGKLQSQIPGNWYNPLGESDGNPETGHFTGDIVVDITKQ